MRRSEALIFFAFAVVLGIISSVQFAFAEPAMELSSTQIYFTENLGQFGEKTLFRGESGNVVFYLCQDEAAYLFVRDTDELMEDDSHYGHDDMNGIAERPRYKREGMLVRAQFIGANPNAKITGEDRLPHNNNYFLGSDPANWRTNVPNYSSVIYKNIYPGIDLRYYGNNAALKYDFIVQPGADLSRIRIKYDGIEGLSISGTGDLEIETEFGVVFEKAPFAYQDLNGVTQQISVGYEIIEPGVFGFKINGDYDRSQPLVIDPQLIYSTFLGGTGNDYGRGIVFDPAGNMVVAGCTNSTDFPIVNPYQGNFNGYADIFVTKLSPSGDSILFSTFIGGSSEEGAYAVDTDDMGNICVSGLSRSSDFPLVNAFDSTYGDIVSTVVLKLSSSGDSLIFSTYYCGTDLTQCYDLVVDGDNNIIVVGETIDSDLPVYNAYMSSYNGDWEAVILKLPPEGGMPLFSTYFGGTGGDWIFSGCVDDYNNIIVTGETGSSDFPLVNQYKTTIEGGLDIFISKFNSSGDQLIYSTYFGGNGRDYPEVIATDDIGNVFVAGFTESTDFPLVNAVDEIIVGREGFVFKLAVPSNVLIFSSFLGGSGVDWIMDLNVFKNRAHISGHTTSSDITTVNPYQSYLRGLGDTYLSILNIPGNELLFSSYFGGDSTEGISSMDLDSTGNILISGTTASSDFPLMNPYDSTYNGGGDVFIGKFSSIMPELTFGGISGIVSDTGSNPLEGIFVTIMEAPIGDTTIANGTYSIENLDPSTYDIYVSHPDYLNQLISDVEVYANQTTILDIELYNAWPYDAGDANGDENVNGLDVIYSVTYLKGNGPEPPIYLDCPPHGYIYAGADANGSCDFNGLDITYSVAYFKGTGPELAGCPDCPPRD